MTIEVKICGLLEHISILRQEQRETEYLIDSLLEWIKKIPAEDQSSKSIVNRQLQIASDQLNRVQQRMKLLESMADKFNVAKEQTEKFLEEALRETELS